MRELPRKEGRTTGPKPRIYRAISYAQPESSERSENEAGRGFWADSESSDNSESSSPDVDLADLAGELSELSEHSESGSSPYAAALSEYSELSAPFNENNVVEGAV